MHTATGLFLSDRKYIFNLLQKCQIDQSNGCPMPMVSSCNLSTHVFSPLQDDFEYLSVVGALQYIVITCPNIAFTVNKGKDLDDRSSTTGFCIFLGGNPISWGSKKQQVVSISTTKARYRGLADATIEIA
ncbi:hypothetical protein V6Z12_A04G085700 [Gossypium hirsutum]